MKKVFIFVLICMIVFFIFYYIFLKIGNNKISKNETRIDDILSKYLNYEATIEAVIYGNKTENSYTMKQEVKDQMSKMEIIDPFNMSGMIIEKNSESIKITNRLLNVEKDYKAQTELMNNYLFLNTFVEEYQQNHSNIRENENSIIVEINLDNNFNTYAKYKELVINKESYEPIELTIKDNTQTVKARIVYSDIKI